MNSSDISNRTPFQNRKHLPQYSSGGGGGLALISCLPGTHSRTSHECKPSAGFSKRHVKFVIAPNVRRLSRTQMPTVRRCHWTTSALCRQQGAKIIVCSKAVTIAYGATTTSEITGIWTGWMLRCCWIKFLACCDLGKLRHLMRESGHQRKDAKHRKETILNRQ